MKRLRSGLIIFALLIIIGQLIITDYDDLSWSNNAGSYLGIISMIFVIVSMLFSNRYEKKEGRRENR